MQRKLGFIVSLTAALLLPAFASLTGCEAPQEAPADPVVCDPPAPPPAAVPPVISDTVVHDIHSEIVGDDYRIFVAMPRSALPGIPPPDPSQKLPVIYVLDPYWSFGATVEFARIMSPISLPYAIVVGIGYPENATIDHHLLRTRDLTPTQDAAYGDVMNKYVLAPHVAGGGEAVFDSFQMGGADDFLGFIRDELKPFIEKTYPVDAGDSTLIGTSLGGTFAVHALLTQPDTFQRYVITSPGLSWDGAMHLQEEAAYAASHTDLKAKVFLSAGGLEDAERTYLASLSAPDAAQIELDYKFAERAQNLADLLTSRGYPGLSVKMKVIDGETHTSTPGFTMSLGLRTVFDSQYFFMP